MQNINNSFNNNTNSPITVNLPKHSVPKALTTQIGLANDIDFVGRKEELQKVDELLNQNATLLLLNGIGGIGKSTLASYYLNQKKGEFDYYGFVQVNDDIKLSLASAFSTSLNLKSEKIDDLFAEIMNKLQNLEGKKLLIVDDVKEMDNQLDEMNTLMTLKNSGFKILFTSREVKENIPQYFLDIMSVEDARELFLKHYPTDEIDKVDKILEYLDYHTLFIEITAKTLTKRKRTLSLDKMIEKFDNGEFSSIKKNKNESFNQFLNDLFADDKILQDEETLLFLKKLSVLPSIEISFEDLYEFLVCEDEERLEEFLIELVDNGWLIESKNSYKFHQILREFIFDSYTPSFEEFKLTLFYFSNFISKSDNPAQVSLDNKGKEIYFYSLYEVIFKFKFLHNETVLYSHNLGVYYQYLEEYKKALSIHSYNMNMAQKLYGENHIKTADSYDSLAILYKELGEYKKALPLYQKALIIRENLGIFNIETATSYNNIGVLYRHIEEQEQALKMYLKCLEIKENILGIHDPSTAQCYNNIGIVYDREEEYQKAIKYYNKALKVWKIEYGENHPDTAKCYNNLGVSYMNSGNIKQAIQLHKKALKIRENILGKTNYTAQSHLNLGMSLSISNRTDSEAIVHIKEAIKIWENTNPTIPQLLDARKMLNVLQKVSKRVPIVSSTKVNRNDKCPCGSNKKYKKCCGKNG